jgi:hypothetical protein
MQGGEIFCEGTCNNMGRHVFAQCIAADRGEGDCQVLAGNAAG